VALLLSVLDEAQDLVKPVECWTRKWPAGGFVVESVCRLSFFMHQCYWVSKLVGSSCS